MTTARGIATRKQLALKIAELRARRNRLPVESYTKERHALFEQVDALYDKLERAEKRAM